MLYFNGRIPALYIANAISNPSPSREMSSSSCNKSFVFTRFQVQLVGLEEESSEFVCRNTFDHPYPTTKIMWIPDTKGIYPDLLATSGDYLRIWRVGADGWTTTKMLFSCINVSACVAQVSDTETRLECLLNNNKNSDFCAPLTSFDWNEVDPNLLGKHAKTLQVHAGCCLTC